MSAQLFLDHDTFSKARRALITSAVVLIMITFLDIQSDSIELFSLKVGVNHDQLIIFGMITVLYFGYVFSLETVSHYQDFRLEKQKTILRDSHAATRQEIRDFLAFSIILPAMKDAKLIDAIWLSPSSQWKYKAILMFLLKEHRLTKNQTELEHMNIDEVHENMILALEGARKSLVTEAENSQTNDAIKYLFRPSNEKYEVFAKSCAEYLVARLGLVFTATSKGSYRYYALRDLLPPIAFALVAIAISMSFMDMI